MSIIRRILDKILPTVALFAVFKLWAEDTSSSTFPGWGIAWATILLVLSASIALDIIVERHIKSRTKPRLAEPEM